MNEKFSKSIAFKYSQLLPAVFRLISHPVLEELDKMEEIGDDYLDAKELNFDHWGCKMKKYILGLMFLLVPLIAQASDTVTVTVIGTVLNVKDNPVETRRKSLIEAQHVAVEEAIGIYLTARSKVDKSILVEDIIETKTQGRITNYKVLSRKVDGVYYKTKIKAVVSLKEPEFRQRHDVDSQLGRIEPRKMLMGLAYIKGRMPTDAELVHALQNPVPVIQKFMSKVKGETSNINENDLIASVGEQFGLNLSGPKLVDFKVILSGTSVVVSTESKN